MKIHIRSKRSPAECLNILQVNVDHDCFSWFSCLTKPFIFPICGKFGHNSFVLKRRRPYPSFFNALLAGSIIEEDEKGCRIIISTKTGLTAKIFLGFFLIMLAGLLLFDVPLPQYYRKSFFVYVALIGSGLFLIGRQTMKPDELYLERFVAELFEGDHVLYT